MTPHNRHRRQRPHGFTLLELVVVIGIIALLASISFAVLGNMLASAKEAATETTILKVSKLLQQQIGAFYRQHDPKSSEMRVLSGRYRKPGGFYYVTDDLDASLVLATKASFLRAYPQNMEEAAGFDRMPGTDDDIPLFVKWLADHFPTPPPKDTPATHSSELLYLAITQGKVRGAPPVDDSAFGTSEVGDTDGDGYKEFIDAWGQPLRFYRWPTRLVNPFGFVANTLASAIDTSQTTISLTDASNFTALPTPFRAVIGREIIEVTNVSGNDFTGVTRGAQSTDPQAHSAGTVAKAAPFTELASMLLGFINSDVMSHDPDDTRGTLTIPGILATGVTTQDIEDVLHTFDSYHSPLIVSAGADGELGLREPTEIGAANGWGNLAGPDTTATPNPIINPGSSTLADNITNHTAGAGN